ncbi:MAG: hypothetical protein ACTJFR_10070 [Canibacter sp.]
MFLLLLLPVVLMLISFAVRPIRTLIIITRILLFIYAAGMWVLLFMMKDEGASPFEGTMWLLPAGFTIFWLLTFVRRRKRDY